MAGKPIDMSILRRTIHLHVKEKSKRYISDYLGISRNTVRKYISKFIELKTTYESLEKLNDEQLEALFLSTNLSTVPEHLKGLYAFFPYAERELKRVGVTKGQLWEEYKGLYPDGLQSSQFCVHFNRWLQQSNPRSVMHLDHKAGDKLFVDYAGKTLQIIDKETGEYQDVQFFVAVLAASQLTFAEASLSQKKHDFIKSVENSLHFIGGVPKAIVPDNLRSAVTKSDRYEPIINETFLDFSEHYGTSILPARAFKPRDKALVEGAVKILYTRIYSPLRDREFYSIEELNQAIRPLLEKHNKTKFSSRPYSRLDLFIETEKEVLDALPTQKYEIKSHAMVTVMLNGHVYLSEDKHYYSVPYTYIKKKVKILYTSKVVEVYYRHNRIAIHKRIKSPYNYTTTKEHLASTHKFMTEWTPERFTKWAESISEPVRNIIVQVLNKKQHPEQSYKSCMGILSLEKKVGKQRLSDACQRALEYGIYNYKIIQNILERGLDKPDPDNNPSPIPTHQNIRGKKYYE